MSPRTNKMLTSFVFFSLLALTAIPSADGRPCDGHSTHTVPSVPTYVPTSIWTPTYTHTHTHTSQYYHSGGQGNGATVTRTVTATTTETDIDTVTRTQTTTALSHWHSPTPTHWSSSSHSSSSDWDSSPSFSVASASPSPSSGSSGSSGGGQCNTGPIQCCNSVQSAKSLDSGSKSLLDSLDLILEDLNTPIGLTCSPLSALGLGSGGNCAGTTVCCNDNNYNGLINIGCVPIILQL
ncbi:hydrophobin-domain-containing protein [Trametopsis cervina]|nr:hydrophobin-domain-containing protein [Trametopsis cervina]